MNYGISLFRWFSKAAAKIHYGWMLLNFSFTDFLAGNQFFLSLPVAIVSFLMGLNEVMNAGISGVTYHIYVKDGIRPRLRFAYWYHLAFSCRIATLIVAWGDGNCKCSSFRFISWAWDYQYSRRLVLWGRSWKESPSQTFASWDAVCICCTDPSRNLAENQWCVGTGEGETASEIYDRAKENAEPNLEMFIHVTKTDLGQSGMSTCVTRDALFHSETTDTNSERPLSDGDGVLLVPTVKNTLNFVNAKP